MQSENKGMFLQMWHHKILRISSRRGKRRVEDLEKERIIEEVNMLNGIYTYIRKESKEDHFYKEMDE